MVHQILWPNQAATGLEHCSLRHSAAEIVADGLVIGVEEDAAFRIRYQVGCDLRWQVRKVVVTALDETEQTIPYLSQAARNSLLQHQLRHHIAVIRARNRSHPTALRLPGVVIKDIVDAEQGLGQPTVAGAADREGRCRPCATLGISIVQQLAEATIVGLDRHGVEVAGQE